MNGGLSSLVLKKEYRSLEDNVVQEFYIPTLYRANSYKRAVGFFSSSALIEISKGICQLVKNGGKIQLIITLIIDFGIWMCVIMELLGDICF